MFHYLYLIDNVDYLFSATVYYFCFHFVFGIAPLLLLMGLLMAKKKSSFIFEKSLGDLELLAERMESGDLSLEESLAVFEQGVRLTRECQEAIALAEQKVKLLLVKDGEVEAKDF